MAKNRDKLFNRELAKASIQPAVKKPIEEKPIEFETVNEKVEEPIEEPVVTPEKTEEPEIVEESLQEEPVKEEIQEPVENVVDAVIDGVDVSLNIRKEPEVKPNNQIAILGKGVKIKVVDPEKPVKNAAGEWYKIRIVDADPKDPAGNGYAMKKYIKII